MTKTLSFALIGIFAAGMFFLSTAQTKSITATGIVEDSATSSGIPGAMVLLYAASLTDTIDPNNLGSLKFDTAFSGADGKFQHKMTIPAQAYFLFHGVFKLGYMINYDTIPTIIFSTTVPVPTIKISKIDNSVRDTLTVSGTVADLTTRTGISGALVIMSTGGGFDTIGNTVLTNNYGTFSKQVIISKLNGASIVSYIITDPNYQTNLGKNTAIGKQLDLGTIVLKRNTSAIRQESGAFSSAARINRMSVYSLNGRLLYDGSALSLDKIVRNRHGALIVSLQYDNSIVTTKKYTPIK
jgi:hypothetical protein